MQIKEIHEIHNWQLVHYNSFNTFTSRTSFEYQIWSLKKGIYIFLHKSTHFQISNQITDILKAYFHACT